MRARQRSVFQSPLWAYFVCFVAGGVTIGLATYAFRMGVGGTLRAASAHAGELSKDRHYHRVAVAASREEPKVAGPDVAAIGQSRPSLTQSRIAAPAEELIARVSPSEEVSSEPASPVMEAAPVVDSDTDEGLSAEVWAPERSDTYRTVCVRLCDGSYTPISFATTRDKFKADAAKCTAGCSSPTRLFYAKAGTTELEELIDMHGASYVDLSNAFRFQTTYEAGCSCRGQPWEAASLLRHRQFAAMAAADRGMQSRAPERTDQTLARAPIARETVAASGDQPVLAGAGAIGEQDNRSVMAVQELVAQNKPIRWNRLNVAAAHSGHELTDTTDAGETKDEPARARIPQSVLKPAVASSTASERGAVKASRARLASPSTGTSKARPASVAVARSGETRSVKSVALRQPASNGHSAARDTLVNERGNARAQREFRTQDYWRLSFWEPR